MRKILKHLLRDRIETVRRNEVIGKWIVIVKGIAYRFAGTVKVACDHRIGWYQPLQNDAHPTPSGLVIGEEKRLVLANRPAAAAAELVVSKTRSTGGRPEKLAGLKRAVTGEFINNAMKAV